MRIQSKTLIVLGFILSCGVSHPAQASFLSWCRELLRRPAPIENLRRDLDQNILKYLGPDADLVRTFLQELPENAQKLVIQRLQETLAKDLLAIARRESPATTRELLEAYSLILRSDLHAEERVQAWLRWAQGEEKAILLYERALSVFGNKEPSLIIEYLNQHPVFRDSIRMKERPELLITQSFEKETPSSHVTYYFRPKGISDEEWLEFSEKERLEELLEKSNEGQTLHLLDKTSLAPGFINHLYREANSSRGNAVFEIKKRGYNISPEQNFRELQILTRDLKETHSIHSHVVFYAPANDPQEFEKFQSWFDLLNNYYLLKGMEEGLHRSTREVLTNGRSLIGLPEEARNPKISPIRTFGEVTEAGLKWFNVGLRGTIYGSSHDPHWVRVGLEARDVSRNLEVVREFNERVSRSASVRVWKMLPQEKSGRFRLKFSDRSILEEAYPELRGEERSMMSYLHRLLPESALPFLPLEHQPRMIITPENGLRTESVSQGTRESIVRARKVYREELLRLARDVLASQIRSGRAEDPEAVEMTLKWILTEWAKTARASELFSGF